MTPEHATEILSRRLERLEREIKTLKGEAKRAAAWVSTRVACQELDKSPRALYQWCRRKGVVRQNGFIARADLDRAISKKRTA